MTKLRNLEKLKKKMEVCKKDKESSKKYLIICDFDGTLSTIDMGYTVLKQFSGRRWEAINCAYCSGAIGSRDAYTRAASQFNASREEMITYVMNHERIDPHFINFYQFCKDRNIDFKIVSDGLDFYIEAILKKYGLEEITFYSNNAIFQDDNTVNIEFPQYNNECAKCGTCKTAILNKFRLVYSNIIYIGDGYSDVCAAKDADLVYAKGVLYDRCLENGTSCLYFDNFKDIKSSLEDMMKC